MSAFRKMLSFFGRRPHTGLPRASELPRRRRVWSLLFELLSGTDLQTTDLNSIAARLFVEGYSWREIEAICVREVGPAVLEAARLQDGLPLEERILALLSREDHASWVAANEERLRGLLGANWRQVARYFRKLDVATH